MSEPRRWRAVAIVGPTASGKSDAALAVARRFASSPGAPSVELVSVDSMAVYRGMDIGTDKPPAEVRRQVRYHMLDLVPASEEFSVARFQRAATAALADIGQRGSLAVLVGGTGLHLRAVVDGLALPGRYPAVAAELDASLDDAERQGQGTAALAGLHARLAELDPVAAGRIVPSNRRRIVRALEVTLGSGRPFSAYGPGLERYPPTPVAMVGITSDGAELERRIDERVGAHLSAGFLGEVERLLAAPGGLSRTARQAVGYRELLAHLEGEVSLDEAVGEIIRRTRTLAKRQRAWFGRDPRIVWVDRADVVDAVLEVSGAT